jgi:hypothetical protein
MKFLIIIMMLIVSGCSREDAANRRQKLVEAIKTFKEKLSIGDPSDKFCDYKNNIICYKNENHGISCVHITNKVNCE